MAKDEAKIKFTAETGDFNAQIKSANSTMQELRSELKLNAQQMKTAGETTELLKERQAILQKELSASKDKTDALNSKVEAATRIYGEDSEEVKKLQTQLNNAKSAEEAIEREISETNTKLDAQKISLESVSKAADSVGDKLTDAGKKMSAVSAGIVGIGTASFAAFNEVDEGADNVIKATGATGEAAVELEATYKKVAQSVVGDFGDIGSAVGEINTRFGYTGSELETASLKFAKFSEITGVDATEAVKSVSRALNDAGIPLDEYDTLLDQLAKAGQAAGIDVTTMTDSLSKNGAVMRAMGFDTQETIALLAQFELSGADTQTMLAGMKKAMANWADEGKNGSTEFAKLVEGVQNGSVTASDAIDVFGSKAGPLLVDAIKSGKFEYQDLLKVIQDSKGTVETTFDGTVDGGYKMELAMQNAKVALGEVGATLGESLSPIIDTASEKLQSFASWWSELDSGAQNTIITIAGVVAAVGPALLVFGQIAKSVSAITNAMNLMKNSTALATIATKAQSVAQGALNLVMNANPITLIVVAIAALVAAFVVLWNNCEGFRNFWIGLWDGIKNACGAACEWLKEAWNSIKTFITTSCNAIKSVITTVWNGIKNAISAVVNAIKTVITNGWNGIKNAISAVVNAIKTVITNVWNGIKTFTTTTFNAIKSVVTTVWNGIKNTVSNVVNGVKDKVSNVWNGIKTTTSSIFNGIKSTASNVWNGIKSAITNPLETAKNAVKNVIDKIKSFFSFKISWPKIPMPHFGIKPDGWKIGDLLKGEIPRLSIDWYAEGGIMTRPTIFSVNGNRLMAGGEAGPEAILPIDKLEGYISDAVEKKMGVVNLEALANAIEDLASRPIALNVNGRQFALATASDGDSVNGLRSTFKSRGLAID